MFFNYSEDSQLSLILKLHALLENAADNKFQIIYYIISLFFRPVDFSALSYSGTTLSSCHYVDRIPFQPPVVVTVRPPVTPISKLLPCCWSLAELAIHLVVSHLLSHLQTFLKIFYRCVGNFDLRIFGFIIFIYVTQ